MKYFILMSLSFFVSSCYQNFDLRQEVAGLDSIKFIFDIKKQEKNDTLQVTLRDKHYRRNFVNSLSIENQKNIDIKSLQKIANVIFQRKNINVILLEGQIFKDKNKIPNQYYFYCQFQQKIYIKKINQDGIDLLVFMQQFPEVANGLTPF